MSTDPRTWIADDVDRFARSAPPADIVELLLELAANPDEEALRVMRLFLGASHEKGGLTAVPAQAAVEILISVGEPGVAIVRDVLVNPPDDRSRRFKWKPALLASLYFASRGDPMPWPRLTAPVPALESLVLSPAAQSAAGQALRDVIAECVVNPTLFRTVAQFIRVGYELNVDDPRVLVEFISDVIRLMAESSIRLSRSLITAFEGLLAAREREEGYQRFLADHPVFLDPLSQRVIPKQTLGTEFATDFAVRRLDGRWLLVEIEKPQDRIFTQAYDFTAEFTHAFGQVLDFQHWVDDNVAYAQRHLDGVTAPRGLLVIGMRETLDERAQSKLERFVDNSARIDVVTFDDLLAGAENLYATLHRAV